MDALASAVHQAQEQIDKAIQIADLRNDPLCIVLKAISASLAAQHALHVAVVADRQVPISPAVLEHVDQAFTRAATKAQQDAGRLITEAAEWSAEQLRAAAPEIAAILLHETQAEVAKAEAAQAAAIRAAWIAGGVSIAGCVIVGAMVIAAARFV